MEVERVSKRKMERQREEGRGERVHATKRKSVCICIKKS